ncbi:Vacuolar membrane protein [Vanrija pseudolonga]|uniref:Vacuolar membrane protein n=1 Tax=Vanrija pseudolonga TaxID=143232 RepID=A0AAF0YDZ4_9TREE|nr:Vacuolar membrane protein [Vanrija pseudolonga]
MSNNTSPVPSFPGSTEPPPPDAAAARCHLLGPTALVVQAIMGVIVISSLVVKRQLEKRKRRWRVWILDVGKQLVGQAVLHGLNILISSVVAHANVGEDVKNPCSLYFLNILIDTTIGVGIFYVALKGFTWLFATHYGLEGYKSGYYGNPPQWQLWGRQLQPYLLAVVTMKLIVLLPLTLPKISNVLIRWGQNLLSWLSVDSQVIFVLAIFPVIMNVFQFCVMDQLIKAGKGAEAKDDHDSDNYDDDDDEEGYRPLPTRETDVEASFAMVSPRHRNTSLRDSDRPGGLRSRSGSRSSIAPIITTSRSSSVTASAPTSPLYPPAAQDDATGQSVWSAVAHQQRRSSNATDDDSGLPSRQRRSDAPSPDSNAAWVHDGQFTESPVDGLAPQSHPRS